MKRLVSSLVAIMLLLPAMQASAATLPTSQDCVARTTAWVVWFDGLNQGYKPAPSDAQTKVQSFCDAFSSQPYLGADFSGLNQGGVYFWNAVEKYAALNVLGYSHVYPGIDDGVRTYLVNDWYNFQVGVPTVWHAMDNNTPCTLNYCALTGNWKN